MEDDNPYIDHPLQRLDEQSRNQTSFQNIEIQQDIFNLNAEQESRKLKIVMIKEVESYDDLTTGSESSKEIQQNSPAGRRNLLQHQERRDKYLTNSQKGRRFVVDRDFADGRLKKGANHKRASTDEVLDNLRDFQPPFRESNRSAGHAQRDQAIVEKYLNEIYDRSAHLLPPVHNAESEVEHEASAMSGKSPGRGRPRKPHSSINASNSRDNHTDEPPLSSPTLAEEAQEVADSEDSYVGSSVQGWTRLRFESSATG